MAAIGPGWVDGAWVEASWIPSAWGAAVAAAAAVDARRDAGTGRRRVVDPYDLYSVPRRQPDIEKAKRRVQARAAAAAERVERLEHARAVVSAEEIASLGREVAELRRAAGRLELSVGLTETYRLLLRKARALETELGRVEMLIAHRERLLREDEEIITILALIV